MAPTEITWFAFLQGESILMIKEIIGSASFFWHVDQLTSSQGAMPCMSIKEKEERKKERPIDKPEEKSILKQYKQEVSLQIN